MTPTDEQRALAEKIEQLFADGFNGTSRLSALIAESEAKAVSRLKEEFRLLYGYAHKITPMRDFEAGPPPSLIRAMNFL